jgi:hypothetical protein
VTDISNVVLVNKTRLTKALPFVHIVGYFIAGIRIQIMQRTETGIPRKENKVIGN